MTPRGLDGCGSRERNRVGAAPSERESQLGAIVACAHREEATAGGRPRPPALPSRAKRRKRGVALGAATGVWTMPIGGPHGDMRHGQFRLECWEEKTTPRSRTVQADRASIEQAFSGGIVGERVRAVARVLPPRPDSGLRRVPAHYRTDRRPAPATLFWSTQTGRFDGKEAKGKLSVVPGFAPKTCAARASSADHTGPRRP
jgi:hypothetical protein